MQRLFTVIMGLCASVAGAGPLAENFGKGLFGVEWSANRNDIEAALPGGRWTTLVTTQCYEVGDGRAVLEVARGKRDKVSICLGSSGEVAAFSVEFTKKANDFETLISNATRMFGKPDPRNQSKIRRDEISISRTAWGVDEGISVTVSRTITVGVVTSITVMREPARALDRMPLVIPSPAGSINAR
jgi:hypothetical protein